MTFEQTAVISVAAIGSAYALAKVGGVPADVAIWVGVIGVGLAASAYEFGQVEDAGSGLAGAIGAAAEPVEVVAISGVAITGVIAWLAYNWPVAAAVAL